MLRQAFAHCGKFLAAASRRSGDRVSVPLWLAVLSDQLPITALVGRYPTNKLIGRRPLHRRVLKTLSSPRLPRSERMRNYPAFPRATPHQWAGSPRVPHPSATLTSEDATFDLHALGTPPALILSQDQTLHQICCRPTRRRDRSLFHIVRASSTMRPVLPSLPKESGSNRRVGPPSSAAHSASLKPTICIVRFRIARQPTCQGAAHKPQANAQPSLEGRLIYHIPLPVSRKDQVRQVLAHGANRSENPLSRAAQSTMFPERSSMSSAGQNGPQFRSYLKSRTGAQWTPAAV